MRIRFLLLPLALLAASACQRTEPTSSAPIIGSTRTPDAALRNTRWELRRLASVPVDDSTNGHEPFLRITEAGTVEGQGSCNTFRGTLQPVDNDGELHLSPLQSTRMACPALSTERLFTSALATTHAYRISGDTLWLYGTNERKGTPLARLVAVHLRR